MRDDNRFTGEGLVQLLRKPGVGCLRFSNQVIRTKSSVTLICSDDGEVIHPFPGDALRGSNVSSRRVICPCGSDQKPSLINDPEFVFKDVDMWRCRVLHFSERVFEVTTV